jgi:hypothetical protein
MSSACRTSTRDDDRSAREVSVGGGCRRLVERRELPEREPEDRPPERPPERPEPEDLPPERDPERER